MLVGSRFVACRYGSGRECVSVRLSVVALADMSKSMFCSVCFSDSGSCSSPWFRVTPVRHAVLDADIVSLGVRGENAASMTGRLLGAVPVLTFVTVGEPTSGQRCGTGVGSGAGRSERQGLRQARRAPTAVVRGERRRESNPRGQLGRAGADPNGPRRVRGVSCPPAPNRCSPPFPTAARGWGHAKGTAAGCRRTQ